MSTFVIGDTHWGHAKSLTFLRPDGERLRPFSSVEEMDELMVENWNRTVSKEDTVYHLGDVAIPRASLSVLERLNGRKILIKGNHDTGPLSIFSEYFENIHGAFYYNCGSRMGGGLVFTHVPVHPANLTGHYIGNVHGHLHCHIVQNEDNKPDRRYFNCCVEVNNYTPVSIETVKAYFSSKV